MKISIDTRTLEPGDIFIPIKGPNFDGHQFIAEALQKGASQILDVDIAKFAAQYRKKLRCHIIAVTGSAGKTTVKDMLYYILKQKYEVKRSEENQNNEIGVPLNLLKADSSTQILILEMGMRAKGEINYLTQIVRPSHIIITSIGLTHIERLKTQRNIALTKAEIFKKSLKWEAWERIAYLNYSSAYYDLLQEKALTSGYTVFPFQGETKIEQNINACYLIGKQFSLTDDQIQNGINQYQPSSNRLNQKKLKEITLINDTYNANPDGVIFALDYLKQFNGRKIFIFADMLELGSHSDKEHQKVVDHAINSGIDIMFTFGKATAIMKSKTLSIEHFDTKKELLKMLLLEIKPGDTILVKGSRGMKMEEITNALEEKYA